MAAVRELLLEALADEKAVIGVEIGRAHV